MATTSITKEFFVIDQKAFERMKRDLDKKHLFAKWLLNPLL